MTYQPIKRLAIIIFLAGLLLAGCAPFQPASPTSSNTQVPDAGSTANVAGIQTAPVVVVATGNPVSTATSAANSTNTPAGYATSTAYSSGGSGIKYLLDASSSTASYSVQEQLAKLNLPTMAVGTTNSISGQIIINPDGSIDSTNSKFTVDVSTLRTDSSMRDNYVARNILQSDQFPQAVFVPTQTKGLPATIPQSGSLTYQLIGNLTIRNVTKPITWDVTGSITNGIAGGTATTSFTFEDFNLSQPSVPIVLSVVDKITLTITISLKPAGG
jgi:polyisoprenoid-binding protein YceI